MPNFNSINPATGQVISSFEYHAQEDIDHFIGHAHERFKSWKRTSFEERAHLMKKAAELLESKKEEYAVTITQEMGKTFASSISEIEKCAWVCRYYADHGQSFLKDEFIETDASRSYIHYQPLGVILAVMPWNYPFWQVFRFAAPALMAGNTAILKHASNVPQSAKNIEEVFRLAGFPSHCFTTIFTPGNQVVEILKNRKIKAATLTGSEPAGSSIAKESGALIKKTVLELGGSDPYIVLEDADISLAVSQCVESRLLNSGQSCIGAKRFIIHEDIYDEFLDRFIEQMASKVMGNPMEKVDVGPLAREDLRNEVHDQVKKSIAKGAILKLGGTIPHHVGYYYPPTILTDVRPGMPAYDEEIFGPVAAVIKVKNEKEAIEIANDTPFGLGACIFTMDSKKGERIASQELEAGCCFVNQYVKSDPRLPFGGIKSSGYGRELSYLGIREFVNVKTVYVK